MDVVVVDSQLWKDLQARLERMEKLFLQGKEESVRKSEWVKLEEFRAIYDVKKTTWYDVYRHVIRHVNDGTYVWVHQPSMEAYLKKKAVN